MESLKQESISSNGTPVSQALGKQSVRFTSPVYLVNSASVVGKKEGEGPLGDAFDVVIKDDKDGFNTWEEAESALQRDAVTTLLKKSGARTENIRYLFAGDLLGQSIASTLHWIVWCMLHLWIVNKPWKYGCCRWICRKCHLCHFQSFCQCGKRIPVSAFLRKPETLIGHMDSYR